jgi:hypothetical protein
MATRFWMRRTKTITRAQSDLIAYQDMTGVRTATGTPMLINATPPGGGPGNQPDGSSYFALFYSDRFAASFTLSGAVTASVTAGAWPPTLTVPVRPRVKLSKITSGGSDIETAIGTFESSTDMSGNVSNVFSFTPPTSITIAPNERLIARLYYFMPGGGDWNVDPATFSYDASASAASYIELADTVTTKPNGAKLWLRRTTTIGISTFMDLLPVLGSTANTTAVVNTAAGGTEIQWTKTAGGALAHWITKRFKYGWSVDDVNSFDSRILALESNASANVTLRLKIFKRKPDGTEVLVATKNDGAGTELPVTVSARTGVMTSVTPMTVEEDDRLILRAYAANAGTMGGGFTATINYDSNVDSGSGNSSITIFESAEFKEETDPARSFTVPSGGQMLGLSNGQ